MNEIISIIMLSLFVSVISTLAATVFGVLISLVILFKDFRLKKLVIKLTNTFMSMPPVLMGLLMYLLLSRKGPFGSFRLLFTPTAIVITQTFLILPIIISLTYSYLNSIEEDIRRNCAALGISKKHTVYIMIKEKAYMLKESLKEKIFSTRSVLKSKLISIYKLLKQKYKF